MKVLHVISGGDKGGAKTHVFTLLSALMEEIDVRVACFMEGVFWREVCETDIPHMLIKQRYRNDFTVVGKLVKHIREERYDIIHAHGARANFVAIMLRPFIKIPIITTVHSDYRLDFTDGFYKKVIFTNLNALALRFLDYYIAVSDSFKEMLVKRNFESERIYTVYNAIDFHKPAVFTDREKFFSRYGVDPSGKTVVGIIGRFDKVKGHEVFIKAAARILATNKDVIFLLAGEGAEQHSLENLARQLGIRDRLFFLGFVNDIYSFINAIDINTCSSYSESFPYMLLEGALMRKPTVSTAVGGIRDLIRHDETGLLVDAGDYEELAACVLRLIDEPESGARLGAGLHDFACRNFSADSMKKRHMEIYTDVLRRHRESGKLFDIMLSGYYGFNNSGDDAILDAIIQSLRIRNEQAGRGELRLIVLSKNPRQTAARYGVSSVKRFNFFNIIKYMKRIRVFLYGGGSIIQDITSTNSLIYYTSLIHLAKRYGARVMLYANGIGPITRKKNIARAQRALNMCDYMTMRDPESFAELERLGVSGNCSLSCDPALGLETAEPGRIDEIRAAENIEPGRKYFALSFRQWKRNDAYFAPKMAEVIDRIVEKYDMTPLFVPMQFPSDVIMSREIIARLKSPSVMLSRSYSVSELAGVIGRTELVIGMRLHTLIFAAGQGIPVIGIVYDPKVKSFIQYIGQDTYVDCESLDGDRLLAVTDRVMSNYGAVRDAIREEAAKLKSLSNQDAEIVMELLY